MADLMKEMTCVNDEYEHVGDSRYCNRCDKSRLVKRLHRESETELEIHFGNIAFGNSKIGSTGKRRKLKKDHGGGIYQCSK